MGLLFVPTPMIRIATVLGSLLLFSCGMFKPAIPQPKEEFRAAWIATVANIDWPPSGQDSWESQQQAYLELLDFYQQLNFNTVIVQVRTAGDALYPTDMAPWSRYLSGTEGIPPRTAEDPLEWLIDQAHRRGIDFHAWLNPYRATMSLDTTSLAAQHDYYRHPDWMLAYGNRYYYNPGLPGVQEHLAAIMREVVANYEVDGIHFDDYFYPYKIAGEVFADSVAYQSLAPAGQSLADWRRSNVDSLVFKVHRAVKQEKPWVQFGISPFGVWRNRDQDPGGSDTQAGQTTYDDLYADPLNWIRQGWIDYIVPQVYWSLDYPPASHRKLASWWASKSDGAHLYIGNAAYKIRNNADKAWKKKKELAKQISLARSMHGIGGNVLFSAKSLRNQPDVTAYLKKHLYPYPALTPGTQGERAALPPHPQLTGISEEAAWYTLRLDGVSMDHWQYALFYAARSSGRLDLEGPSQLIEKTYLEGRKTITLGKRLVKGQKVLALTFLDHYGRESGPIVIHLNQITTNDPEK